ncbi:hypothetical protein AAVH_29836 [Aphelenchoides avenae]|nr:hypothetical protein AAVH_29836 [Aphelenchus avenae]
MYEPLYSLAKDYMMTDSRDGYEMALKLFAEITQCLDERLLREVGVCIYDKMAACYDNLDDEANARKYARMAADVDRICTGSDDALFKKKYENSARCKHLL